jgi:hypothetical protein
MISLRLMDRWLTRVGKTSQQKRIAIRGRIHDDLGGDVRAGTRPVLDHELLAEPLRQSRSWTTKGEDVLHPRLVCGRSLETDTTRQ